MIRLRPDSDSYVEYLEAYFTALRRVYAHRAARLESDRATGRSPTY